MACFREAIFSPPAAQDAFSGIKRGFWRVLQASLALAALAFLVTLPSGPHRFFPLWRPVILADCRSVRLSTARAFKERGDGAPDGGLSFRRRLIAPVGLCNPSAALGGRVDSMNRPPGRVGIAARLATAGVPVTVFE